MRTSTDRDEGQEEQKEKSRLSERGARGRRRAPALPPRRLADILDSKSLRILSYGRGRHPHVEVM
eukprot:8044664-Pyramimonas_sp.AAC.1